VKWYRWSNPYGDQATHFVNYIERPNAPNSSCNYKKIGNTSNARPTMCVSSANEGKTQVRWVVAVKQKVRKWASANNTPSKGSPYHVLDWNEMIMKSLCLKTWTWVCVKWTNKREKLIQGTGKRPQFLKNGCSKY